MGSGIARKIPAMHAAGLKVWHWNGSKMSACRLKPFWKSTDPEIARNAVRELESHVCIRADMIKVTIKEGWITLEGYVDGEYARNLAISAVRKLKGG
jgi:osmotically-inducible protein OsmY